MPKKRRQAKIPTPAWERPRGAIGSRVLGRGFQFYGAVVISMLIGVALAILGYAFLADYLETQGRPGSTAVQVDDTRYRLDHFTNRLKMYVDQNGGPGVVDRITALSQVPAILIQEEIVRRFSGEFDITASEEEILQEIATRLGINADDETFDVVFQQELTRSGLSELEFRDMISALVLETKLLEMFEAELSPSAESVRYRQILVSTDETAQELRGKIEAGEDFAALAAENSQDVGTRDSGGEVGWVPRGVLDASTEELVFALEPAEITTIPLPQGVLLIEMEEKAEDREVEESQRAPLASRALADWVQEKRATLDIVISVVPGADSYDQKKAEWAVNRAYTQESIPVTGGQGG
ncbi:MAG: peptidylprolyl isomerase [Chloroflexi bacterium]|nr:peptidylprolyl isomerase [Chloroflexota bacterium]